MFVLVDLENPAYSRWEESLERQKSFRALIEEISGQTCSLVCYRDINPYFLNRNKVSGMIVSGNFSDWDMYLADDLAGLLSTFSAGLWPTLAICGGFQLMAQEYGAEIGPIKLTGPARPLKEEPLLFETIDEEKEGLVAEVGFTTLDSLQASPILASLPEKLTVWEYHYWEVKSIPEGFHNLATSENCPIQFIAHDEKPLYGCEFHPEVFTDEFPHGRQILSNFFQLVGKPGRDDLPLMA